MKEGFIDKQAIIKIIEAHDDQTVRELAIGRLYLAGVLGIGDTVPGHGVLMHEQLQEYQAKFEMYRKQRKKSNGGGSIASAPASRPE
jgi:hypothetical protein